MNHTKKEYDMEEFLAKLKETLGLDSLVNFDWENDGWLLASKLPDHFFFWWDSEKYNWVKHGWALPMHCAEKFDYWYDADKYFWSRHAHLLHKFCKHKQDIWGPDYVEHKLNPR